MGDSAKLLFEREKQRWEKALASAEEELFREIHASTRDSDAFLTEVSALERVVVLAGYLLERGFAFAPKLFVDVGGRRRGDRYLSGIQWGFAKVSRSYLLTTVVPLLKLEAVAEKVVPYLAAVAGTSHDASLLFEEAVAYTTHWAHGEEIMRSFQRKPREDLIALYASYKSWEHDERCAAFHDTLSRFSQSAIEIFVEGPLQLYLMLAEEITVILRLPIFERLSEITETEKMVGFADLKLLADDIREAVENSVHPKLLVKLLSKTAEKAIASWYEEESRLRSTYDGFFYRKRFVEAFEEGTLFRGPPEAS